MITQRTLISNTKLVSHPVVLCVVVNFTEYLLCIGFSHYRYLLSNARREFHTKVSMLTTYSFFKCRYILTRFTHSSQVVGFYQAYVSVFLLLLLLFSFIRNIMVYFLLIFYTFLCVSRGFNFETYIFGFTCLH